MLEQIVAPLFAFFIMLNIHPLDRVDYFLEAVDHHDNVLQALKKPLSRKTRIMRCVDYSKFRFGQQRDIISEGRADKPESGPVTSKRKIAQSSD